MRSRRPQAPAERYRGVWGVRERIRARTEQSNINGLSGTKHTERAPSARTERIMISITYRPPSAPSASFWGRSHDVFMRMSIGALDSVDDDFPPFEQVLHSPLEIRDFEAFRVGVSGELLGRVIRGAAIG
jgi:hypothetical protein